MTTTARAVEIGLSIWLLKAPVLLGAACDDTPRRPLPDVAGREEVGDHRRGRRPGRNHPGDVVEADPGDGHHRRAERGGDLRAAPRAPGARPGGASTARRRPARSRRGRPPPRAPPARRPASGSAIYRAIRNFAEVSRADKIVMTHGPNGSAKSTIAELLFKGLEAYSATPEGAIYRFAWVFPRTEVEGAGLGFGGRQPKTEDLDTFAYLEPDAIASTVASDMKTNPFYLVPRENRKARLQEFCGGPPPFPHVHVLRADMGTKSRAIFDALMTAYKGDWKKVMRFVQVERFYITGGSRNARMVRARMECT